MITPREDAEPILIDISVVDPELDSDFFAKEMGAESVHESLSSTSGKALSPISLFAVRRELARRLKLTRSFTDESLTKETATKRVASKRIKMAISKKKTVSVVR